VNTKTENAFSLAELVNGLVPDNVDIELVYSQFNASVRDEIDELVSLREAGEAVIPEVSFAQLCSQGFTTEQANLVRRRGCVVVRGIFSESETNHWNQELHQYLSANHYYTELQKAIEAGDADRAEHPHMLDIYWSKSKSEIRQSSQLNELKRNLNGIRTIASSQAARRPHSWAGTTC